MKTRNSARAVILIALAGVCILATSASDPVYQNTKQIVTLALLGDISLARGVQPEADSFSALAAQLNSADLALANLESPLDPKGTPEEQATSASSYNLCAPAENTKMLKAWGLDLLSLANNHAFDCSQFLKRLFGVVSAPCFCCLMQSFQQSKEAWLFFAQVLQMLFVQHGIRFAQSA